MINQLFERAQRVSSYLQTEGILVAEGGHGAADVVDHVGNELSGKGSPKDDFFESVVELGQWDRIRWKTGVISCILTFSLCTVYIQQITKNPFINQF